MKIINIKNPIYKSEFSIFSVIINSEEEYNEVMSWHDKLNHNWYSGHKPFAFTSASPKINLPIQLSNNFKLFQRLETKYITFDFFKKIAYE